MVWKAVAGFFYFEIAICLLLLFPILSARRWSRILNSSLIATIWSYIRFYFHIFGLLLVALFIGAVREMWKQEAKRSRKMLPDESNKVLEQLFRAQRNFFVSMFAALLLYVLYRIGSLVLAQATLELESEGHQLQLKEAAKNVTQATKEQSEQKPDSVNLELKLAKDEIINLKEQLQNAKVDKEVMQADVEMSRAEIENLAKRCSEMKALLAGNKDTEFCTIGRQDNDLSSR